MTSERNPRHREPRLPAKKRVREANSLGWLLFRDEDMRLLIGLPVTAVVGIAMLVVGLLSPEAWMIVVGAAFGLVSVLGLIVILTPKRK